MKNMSVKKIIGIVVGAVVALAVVGIAAVMLLRVDAAEARQIALETSGGGEVLSQEISNEQTGHQNPQPDPGGGGSALPECRAENRLQPAGPLSHRYGAE